MDAPESKVPATSVEYACEKAKVGEGAGEGDGEFGFGEAG